MLATGSSIDEAEAGGWLLGPFPASGLWQPWTARALTGGDWAAVLAQAGGIATAGFVCVLALLLNSSGIELMLDRNLDSNIELRSAGSANVLVGVAGGIPGFHALSLTSLALRMRVAARPAGFVAAAVPLATLLFGAALVSLIPRMLLGGLLLFLGLSFLVEWVIDARRTLPLGEYTIVLAILRGLLPGVALGLVLAVVLFAVSYSRTDLVRQTVSGSVLRSNVDRPPAERGALRVLGACVHILRLQGFVLFGTASSLLERIRERASDAGEPPMRYLVLDFRRVSGVDSSAVLSFRKAVQLARAQGFELVLTAVPAQVRRQLEQGGVREGEAPVSFQPDLDCGLQRCEDALLASRSAAAEVDSGGVGGARRRAGGPRRADRALPRARRHPCRAHPDPPTRSAPGRLCPRVGPP